MSVAIARNWEERMEDLGNVPTHRVVPKPPPGTATCDDVIRVRKSSGRICEMVDRTLVEKAMGWRESFLAGVLLYWLHGYLDDNRLGVATGPDGMTRLFGDTVRAPDVAFVAWDRLPDGRIPVEPIPDVVPNFVIEVLSASNTYGEMSRKRREFFHAGVELMWLVDPSDYSVTVYRDANEYQIYRDGGTLSGEAVLPGWKVDIGELFDKLEQQRDARQPPRKRERS